ncbi:MAG: DUF1963 domain-containing protein [Cardiobacteriaceae bacterium]|nr:DUF1963 domain-containing protein [Cardiobacteriaceae bacterium]
MLNHLQRFLPADIIAKLAQHARPVLSLTLSRAADDLPLTASRVGGFGYWPENQPYPENADGQPLALLAQFNLAALPPHPDLPHQGILAFYINPFHWNYGMDEEDGQRTVYFADTRTPSLTAHQQRELFPEYAFPEPESEALSEEQLAFQARWQNEAEQMLAEWLARHEKAVAKGNDAELTRLWQQEKAALPALADIVRNINAEEDGIPGDWYVITGYFEDALPQTVKYVMQTLVDKPVNMYWQLAEGEMDEAEIEHSVHMHQVLTRQMLTTGDLRWRQYWQHDPRAVLEVDWQMQAELIEFYGNDKLSALWREALPALRANIDAIVAEAQVARVMSAADLDQVLEGHIEALMHHMRETFAQTDFARQQQIMAQEQQMLGERMARLAARFAAQGFVAEGEAPATALDAVRNFDQVYELDEDAHPLASVGELLKQFSAFEEAFGLAEEDEAAEVAALLTGYLKENDAFVAAEDDAELAQLWTEERAQLVAHPPQSKAALLVQISSGSRSYLHLAQQGKVNPAAQAIARDISADAVDWDNAAAAPEWYHPVAGEYALSATLAEHYPFAKHEEFAAIFGQSFYDWVRELALDEEVKREFVEIALQNESHLMGYPYFTQQDPREGRDDVLLFQLDSQEVDGEYGSIMWGDSGIGQFFIARKDLAARRFDKAWLHWDCY